MRKNIRILELKTDIKSNFENLLNNNDKELRTLLQNGMEFITNIKAANEIRNVNRRNNEKKISQG